MSSRVLILATMSLLALPGPADAARFRQDFASQAIDQSMLQVVGLEHECTVERGTEGLRIRIPPGGMQRGPVGIQLKPWLRGDFQVIASFKINELSTPEGGWGAGVGFSIELDSVKEQGLTCERLELPGGRSVASATHITSTTFGKRTYQPERKPAEETSGRLLLTRKRGIVEAAIAQGSGEFRRIRTADMGRDDVKLLRLACYTGQSAIPVDIAIGDVTIEAEEVLSAEQAHRTRPSRRVAQFWALGLLNLGLLGALAAWYFPRLVSRGLSRLSRRKATLLTFAGFVSVLAVSMANHLQAMRENHIHEDESTYIIMTYFARLAFVDGDLEHPMWGDYDGLDGPHAGHMLIAAGLAAAGEPLHETPSRSFTWVTMLPVSEHRLMAGRLLPTLLGALVAPMTFLIGVWATGSLVAALAAGFICAVHPLSLTCNARAMNEGPLMFFSVLAMLLLQWALRGVAARGDRLTGKIPREFVALIVACPLALGLAINTKLTAVYHAAVVFVAVGLAAVGLTSGHTLRRRDVAGWAAYVALFVALTAVWSVDLNPSLYTAPISRTQRMFENRWSMQGVQREAHPEFALYTMCEKAWATHLQVAKQGLGSFSLVLTGLSGLGVLALATAPLRRRSAGGPVSPTMPLAVWSFVMAGALVPTIVLNWDRYFLPVVPPWALLTGIGLDAALRATGAAARRWLARHWDARAAGSSVGPIAAT